MPPTAGRRLAPPIPSRGPGAPQGPRRGPESNQKGPPILFGPLPSPSPLSLSSPRDHPQTGVYVCMCVCLVFQEGLYIIAKVFAVPIASYSPSNPARALWLRPVPCQPHSPRHLLFLMRLDEANSLDAPCRRTLRRRPQLRSPSLVENRGRAAGDKLLHKRCSLISGKLTF